MEFFVGDKLELKAAAYDPAEPSHILYPQGTKVAIVEIINDDVILEFPDKNTFASSKNDVLRAYNRVSADGTTILTRVVEGFGTPSKELRPYLPEQATWTHNYRWKVIVELEDRGKKEYICPSCKESLSEGMLGTQNLTKCQNCDTMVIPAKVSDLLP